MTQAIQEQAVPKTSWYLNIPTMFMDAEPETNGANETVCDGNTLLTLFVEHQGKEYNFYKRFLWVSMLEGERFTVGFSAHPEYEWNEHDALTEDDQAMLGLLKTHHADLLTPSFDRLDNLEKEEFKQQHVSMFE